MNKRLKKGKLVIQIEYEAFLEDNQFESIKGEFEAELVSLFESMGADNPIDFGEDTLDVDFQDAADN